MNKIVSSWTSGSISIRYLLSKVGGSWEGAAEVTECKKEVYGRSPDTRKHAGHLELAAGPLPEFA
jgi:hypothetical protein